MNLSDEEKQRFIEYCQYVAGLNDKEVAYTEKNAPVSFKREKHQMIAASARVMEKVIKTNPTLEVHR